MLLAGRPDWVLGAARRGQVRRAGGTHGGSSGNSWSCSTPQLWWRSCVLKFTELHTPLKSQLYSRII